MVLIGWDLAFMSNGSIIREGISFVNAKPRKIFIAPSLHPCYNDFI